MLWKFDRPLLASRSAELACLCAAAFTLLPKGFLVFGALLVAMTILVPRTLLAAWVQSRDSLSWMILMVAALLALTVASMQLASQGWQVVDNMTRFLVMPWAALTIYAHAPPRRWLWLGAIVGVCIAFVLANTQYFAGIDRVGAGNNPIVFANAVLALLVLVIYCRPHGSQWEVLLPVAATIVLGVIAIILSGSRGALPGFALVVLVALLGSNGKTMCLRLGICLGVLALLFALMWNIPWLATQTRLDSIHSDLVRFGAGDVDTPIGARLQFLLLSWQAFIAHPWTGVGVDKFGLLVQELPQCRAHAQALGLCRLGHAHNDLAQWSATMGIPGLLMIVALYFLPLLQFARIIRANHLRKPVGAAWAGLALVMVYMLSGLTQSMFAHALTTNIYAVFVGLLLGLALRESRNEAGVAHSAGASARVDPRPQQGMHNRPVEVERLPG